MNDDRIQFPRAQVPNSGRPLPGEYAHYAEADIAAVPGDDAVAALEALRESTPGFFRTIKDVVESGFRYAPGKWTLKTVLSHLADDERILSYRLLCVARGEERELPGFDENVYAAHAGADGRSLDSLISDYLVVRDATLSLLRALPTEAWTRPGRANGYRCSPRGLAFHIAGHELHHLRIIRERYLMDSA